MELLARLGKLWILKSRAMAAMGVAMASGEGCRDFIFFGVEERRGCDIRNPPLQNQLCSALCSTAALLLLLRQSSRIKLN
jgi:hypothetical protein